MRPRYQAQFVFLIAIVVVIVASTLASWQNLSEMRARDRDVRRMLRLQTALREVFSLIQDAESSQRGYLLTGAAPDLTRFETASRSIPPRFQSIAARLEDDTAQHGALLHMQDLALQRVSEMQAEIDARQASPRAHQPSASEQRNQTMLALRDVAEQLNNAQYAQLALRAEASRSAFNGARTGTLVAALLACALLLLTFLFELRERRERLAHELRLWAEKERFRITLSSIADGVIVTDNKGLVEFLNPVAERLTGAAHGLGQPIEAVFRVVQEGSRAPAPQPIRQTLAGQMVTHGHNDSLLMHADAKEYPIEDRAAPILDRHGAMQGAVLVFRDVSEKKRVAQALSRSAAEYRALFEEAGVATANLSMQSGLFTRVNRRLEMLTGYAAAELIERPLAELFAPKSQARVDQLIDELRRGSVRAGEQEADLMHKLGRVVHVRLFANVVEGGNDIEPVILAMFEDVTEARLAIDALHESEMRMRIILENVLAFVLLLEPDGRIVQASGVSRLLGGESADPWLGQCLHQIAPFNYDAGIASRVAAAVREAAKGRSFRGDVRARVAHGVYITLDASLTPVYGSGAAPDFLVASGIDISQRKAMEEELQRADRRKDEFLAMLGHELRNPLAPIANALALIKATHGQNQELLNNAIGVIERQSEHLTTLVNDLLDVARFISGKIALRFEELDVREPLNRAIEATEGLFRARRQKFEVQWPDTPLWVRGDLHRLTQVFGNLLNNASKYSDTGTLIGLRVTSQDDVVVIAVNDSGMGISPAMLPHVFDLFTQSERAMDRSQGGLGIGLTLVKRLIELHGGMVTAESPGLGGGSTFKVILHRTPAGASAPGAAAIASGAHQQPLKVLLVTAQLGDDRLMNEMMGPLGYQVTAVDDGIAALSVATQWAPDVVLLDLEFQGVAGPELARKLRHLPETRSALLIALLEAASKQALDAAQLAGFDAHLLKPIDAQSLSALLFSKRKTHHQDG